MVRTARLGTLIRSRRVWPLTVAQACTAFNDNLVKNAMVVLALFQLHEGAAGLSALAGALFIAPYGLLSATSGTLADRFSKSRLTFLYKLAEIALMALAGLALMFASVPALLAVLVGLGVQAALFGPVKYGILPEYLADAELLGGNAIMEATTFLSIVCGTVAGSLLVTLPHGPALVGLTGVSLALVGLASARHMPPVPAADPALTLHANIVRESWHLLRVARRIPTVWLCVLGLSWFWTVGATVIAELPVIVRDELQASDPVFTLLLVVFAGGIGLGSMIAGRLLHRTSLWPVVWAAGGISLFCWDFSHAIERLGPVATVAALLHHPGGWRVLADLTALTACGGLFSVPLYAAMQQAAPVQARSRTVAANNIMNALFMVAGAALLAALAKVGLRAPEVLEYLALANLAVTAWLALRCRHPAAASLALATPPDGNAPGPG